MDFTTSFLLSNDSAQDSPSQIDAYTLWETNPNPVLMNSVVGVQHQWVPDRYPVESAADIFPEGADWQPDVYTLSSNSHIHGANDAMQNNFPGPGPSFYAPTPFVDWRNNHDVYQHQGHWHNDHGYLASSNDNTVSAVEEAAFTDNVTHIFRNQEHPAYDTSSGLQTTVRGKQRFQAQQLHETERFGPQSRDWQLRNAWVSAGPSQATSNATGNEASTQNERHRESARHGNITSPPGFGTQDWQQYNRSGRQPVYFRMPRTEAERERLRYRLYQRLDGSWVMTYGPKQRDEIAIRKAWKTMIEQGRLSRTNGILEYGVYCQKSASGSERWERLQQGDTKNFPTLFELFEFLH